MIKTPRGTKDILPSEMQKWNFIEEKFREVSNLFSYKELRTPIFENTEVFSRGVGEGTDIVGKEMYTFSDRGGNSMTLRPEMTAALVRSAIEHGLTNSGVQRLWYYGPFFRYERPQKGRQRQFHQFGAELLGSETPVADVEIISLCVSLISSCGISDYKLLLNSLGNKISRTNYLSNLKEYLFDNKSKLSETSQIRLKQNPLRILDSKSPEDIKIVESAPILIDFLDSESSDHFAKVKELCHSININYEISPKLVRGLDYYSHTVFELQSTALGAQDAFGGGGRYNELFEQLGGKRVPAIGFAMGVERLLLILESLDKLPKEEESVDIYIISADKNIESEILIMKDYLLSQNIRTISDTLSKSFKAQFKEANKMNAKWVLIIGNSEIEKQKYTLKNMKSSEQFELTKDKISDYIISHTNKY
jgi:histidyl-tRNA synthetase